jgi:hypothetical protein
MRAVCETNFISSNEFNTQFIEQVELNFIIRAKKLLYSTSSLNSVVNLNEYNIQFITFSKYSCIDALIA